MADSFAFFSPNLDEGLSFDQAHQRLRSGNQASFRKLTDHLLDTIGVKNYKTADAIGDWYDGAENSVVQAIHEPIPSDRLQYLAAWYGLMGRQKAVLTFSSDPHGADSVYQIPIAETDTN